MKGPGRVRIEVKAGRVPGSCSWQARGPLLPGAAPAASLSGPQVPRAAAELCAQGRGAQGGRRAESPGPRGSRRGGGGPSLSRAARRRGAAAWLAGEARAQRSERMLLGEQTGARAGEASAAALGMKAKDRRAVTGPCTGQSEGGEVSKRGSIARLVVGESGEGGTEAKPAGEAGSGVCCSGVEGASRGGCTALGCRVGARSENIRPTAFLKQPFQSSLKSASPSRPGRKESNSILFLVKSPTAARGPARCAAPSRGHGCCGS